MISSNQSRMTPYLNFRASSAVLTQQESQSTKKQGNKPHFKRKNLQSTRRSIFYILLIWDGLRSAPMHQNWILWCMKNGLHSTDSRILSLKRRNRRRKMRPRLTLIWPLKTLAQVILRWVQSILHLTVYCSNLHNRVCFNRNSQFKTCQDST